MDDGEAAAGGTGRPTIQPALEGKGVDRLVVRAPQVSRTATVADARRSFLGERHGSVSHVLLVDAGGRFVGMVRDVDLVAAAPDDRLEALAIADPPLVTPTSARDEAVWAALARGESEVAVVDPLGAPIGILPASTLLAVLHREHSDDLARISGYLHQGDSARAATEERVARRFAHRLPWLLFGLAGATLAARIVSGYEQALTTDVELAFFLPGIVYLADAVGTQTETVVIRGLSFGVSVRRIAVREIATSVVLGTTLGALFYPVALGILDSADLAAAVAVALGSACATAGVIALVIPWAIQRSGRDPAFGSGPLATVIQDLLSIILYFFIVTYAIGD